jgi:hypothetical protein
MDTLVWYSLVVLRLLRSHRNLSRERDRGLEKDTNLNRERDAEKDINLNREREAGSEIDTKRLTDSERVISLQFLLVLYFGCTMTKKLLLLPVLLLTLPALKTSLIKCLG